MSKTTKFFTKFNLLPVKHALYNPNDAVDRLTYVDTTQQITRMLQAGVNLKLRNNQGLSGEDFNAPAMPVYAPDVAISQRMINTYRDELKANAIERSRAFEDKKTNGETADPKSTTSPHEGDV